MDATTLSHAGKMVDDGIETVAVTYVLHCAFKQWPGNVTNLPLARKAVEDCRAELKPTRVKLPPPLEALLEEWEQGLKLAGASGAAGAAAAPAAAAGKSPAQAEQAPAEATAPVAAPVRQQGDLAERMRSSKRRRTD